ncbi:hypothetical protein [Azospirillum sp. ST 5-10]|uniref:hypothetical protein n=1 Tax=unclassified Azospirillum TaxID=2630922 RepID=UPI003F49D190
MPGAAMGAAVGTALAATPHHAPAAGSDAVGDCAPEHHAYGDRQGRGGHETRGGESEDHASHTHQGCCAAACGLSALAPAHVQVTPVVWTAAPVQAVGDDRLRDRSVAPLRRPPRTTARSQPA